MSASEPESRPQPLIVAKGLGGRVELWDEEVHIFKGGVFGHAIEILWLGHGRTNSSRFIDSITSVQIVRGMFLPPFIWFSYAGAPALTGEYGQDALAENAVIMNLVDNRRFYDIKEKVDERIALRAAEEGGGLRAAFAPGGAPPLRRPAPGYSRER